MGPQMMAKQTIAFYQTAFEASFNSMVLVQDQMAGWTEMMLEQAIWLPNESKQFAGQWVKASKKGAEAYKKIVDENFKRLSSMLS